MAQRDLSDLKHKLMYEFKNTDLLDESLRHSSFVNEQAAPDVRDNERLEFLGDAVLNVVVGHILMKRYPDLKEGDLSKMRANLVNESQLAAIAGKIGLGSYIQLGRGEIQTNGREKNSILANTFEAVIAAVYLDDGFDAAFKIVERHFLPLLDWCMPARIEPSAWLDSVCIRSYKFGLLCHSPFEQKRHIRFLLIQVHG